MPPADVMAVCADDVPAPVDLTAIDNCDSDPNVTYADFVIPGDCPNEWTIERTWTATDACSNSSSCLHIITIEDTTDPVITCPIDVTVECDVSNLPPATGEATATDNCSDPGDITIGYVDVITA